MGEAIDSRFIKAIKDTIWGGDEPVREIIRLLGDHPELANAVDPQSHKTALMIAATSSSPPIMRLLCEKGANVDERVGTGTEEGWTALHYAIEAYQGGNHIDRVNILLSRKANVNAASRYGGITPLMLAAKNGAVPVIKALCSVKVRGPQSEEGIADLETVTTPGGWSALTYAAYYTKPAAVAALLEAGASPNGRAGYEGMTYPIIEAANAKLRAARRLQVIQGAQAMGGNIEAVLLATEEGIRGDSREIVRLLCAAGANVNVYQQGTGFTALMAAVDSNDVRMAEFIIRQGADINAARLDNGITALHLACIKKDEVMCRLLVGFGANVDIKMADGVTCLMIAAGSYERVPIITVLLDAGAKLEMKDDDGSTALAHACKRNQLQTAVALLKRGAEVDATDNDGNTVLMCTIMQAQVDFPTKMEIIKLLCDNGADLSRQNPRHETPRDLAAMHMLNSVVRLLDGITKARGRNVRAVGLSIGSRSSRLPANVVGLVGEYASGKRGPLSSQLKSLRRNTLAGNRARRWNRMIGDLPEMPEDPSGATFFGGRQRTRKQRRRQKVTRRRV
jgi:ankyrin repeat protein